MVVDKHHRERVEIPLCTLAVSSRLSNSCLCTAFYHQTNTSSVGRGYLVTRPQKRVYYDRSWCYRIVLAENAMFISAQVSSARRLCRALECCPSTNVRARSQNPSLWLLGVPACIYCALRLVALESQWVVHRWANRSIG